MPADRSSSRPARLPRGGGPRRRPVLRRVLIGLGGALVVVVAGGAWAVHAYGPRFGLYLVPPSPQRYAEVALDVLESGYDAHGPAWEAERARVVAAAEGASDYADLHGVLAEATSLAGGKHSSFLTPEETTASEQGATSAFVEPTVTTQDGVTTVTVPEVGSVSEELQQRYADVLARGIAEAAPGTCGWVVDLRGNTGGTMYPMLSGVSPLLPVGPAMSFRSRTGDGVEVTVQDDGAGVGGRTTVVIEAVPKVSGQPVAVLQDGRTASSGEAVLTAFRGLDGVESFGADSAGYTSANSVRRLYDGAQIVLTQSTYVDRDGVDLAEEPVAADHPTTPEDAPDAARAWLVEQGCGTA
ncbi:S41 family peptidase [Sanguibacter suaedae]|uniref:S41 family peptidase n=1 Tax=Sanguibacter suaedae TaxID=2795737 RepID=A0A934M7R0_9MICO|nr:S41 family peptidase [Sanguibacter suaedae]MBI9115692.1 S41 family peptidase [Sanguibacter suaedae]